MAVGVKPGEGHAPQSSNGCVHCSRKWSEHTAFERGHAPDGPEGYCYCGRYHCSEIARTRTLLEWAEQVRAQSAMLRMEPPYTSTRELAEMINRERAKSS
jgi:predicted NBD/HSP70 family sugar kinase